MTRKEFLQEALKEMRSYERMWDYYSRAEKRAIGCTKRELQQKIKEYEKELETLLNN